MVGMPGHCLVVRWWAGVLCGGVVFGGGVGSSPGAFPSMPARLPRLNCAFNAGLPPLFRSEGAVQGGRVVCLGWVGLFLGCCGFGVGLVLFLGCFGLGLLALPLATLPLPVMLV